MLQQWRGVGGTGIAIVLLLWLVFSDDLLRPAEHLARSVRAWSPDTLRAWLAVGADPALHAEVVHHTSTGTLSDALLACETAGAWRRPQLARAAQATLALHLTQPQSRAHVEHRLQSMLSGQPAPDEVARLMAWDALRASDGSGLARVQPLLAGLVLALLCMQFPRIMVALALYSWVVRGVVPGAATAATVASQLWPSLCAPMPAWRALLLALVPRPALLAGTWPLLHSWSPVLGATAVLAAGLDTLEEVVLLAHTCRRLLVGKRQTHDFAMARIIVAHDACVLALAALHVVVHAVAPAPLYHALLALQHACVALHVARRCCAVLGAVHSLVQPLHLLQVREVEVQQYHIALRPSAYEALRAMMLRQRGPPAPAGTRVAAPLRGQLQEQLQAATLRDASGFEPDMFLDAAACESMRCCICWSAWRRLCPAVRC